MSDKCTPPTGSDRNARLFLKAAGVEPLTKRCVAGIEIGHWGEVDSTNAMGQRLLKATGSVRGRWAIRAEHQRGGRGQHGRHWTDEAGRDLCLSVVLCGDLPQRSPFSLNMAVCLSIAQAIEQMLAPDAGPTPSPIAGPKVEVKWPNDIMVNGEKIAGVLIENTWRGSRFTGAVVGIGLNVSGTPPYPGATFLAQHHANRNDARFDLEMVEQYVLSTLAARLERLKLAEDSASQTQLVDDYNAALFGRGRAQSWELDGQTVCGVLDHVDFEGRLWTQDVEDGREPGRSNAKSYAPGRAHWLGFN